MLSFASSKCRELILILYYFLCLNATYENYYWLEFHEGQTHIQRNVQCPVTKCRRSSRCNSIQYPFTVKLNLMQLNHFEMYCRIHTFTLGNFANQSALLNLIFFLLPGIHGRMWFSLHCESNALIIRSFYRPQLLISFSCGFEPSDQ